MIYAVRVIRGDFEIELGLQFVPRWRKKSSTHAIILLIKMHVLHTELQFISYLSAFVLFPRTS